MRNAGTTCAFGVAVAAALYATLAPGCEEVLEACAPCGLVSRGDTSISGDPRIDGTFEAVYRIVTALDQAEARFDEDVSDLADALGIAIEDPGSPSAEEAGAVVAALGDVLFASEGVSAAIGVTPARCWVGSERALERQISCERTAGCYVTSECETSQAGSCTGLCVGDCDTGCAGRCFADAEAEDTSCMDPGSCVGACGDVVDEPCAGRCTGECSEPCAAFDAEGGCDGHCPGLCTGTCRSRVPRSCGGSCAGLCQVLRGEGDTCAGECRGDCSSGGCGGLCRGHFRPGGCDTAERCDGVVGCGAMARGLAWAHMRCEPAAARVSLSVSPSYEGDPEALADLAHLLEGTLARAGTDHAWISLLVDGVDDTGEIGPENLVEPPGTPGLSYLESAEERGVPADLSHLPLMDLRIRLGALTDDLSTGEAFQIAAGPMPCVRPALEEALGMLEALLPTVGGTGGEPLATDRSGGVFRVLDAQAGLMGLSEGGADE